MSKYDPLWEHLQTDGRPTLRLTFTEITVILGFPIDHSFLTYKKEAVAYGYQVGKISMKEQHVTFQKDEATPMPKPKKPRKKAEGK